MRDDSRPFQLHCLGKQALSRTLTCDAQNCVYCLCGTQIGSLHGSVVEPKDGALVAQSLECGLHSHLDNFPDDPCLTGAMDPSLTGVMHSLVDALADLSPVVETQNDVPTLANLLHQVSCGDAILCFFASTEVVSIVQDLDHRVGIVVFAEADDGTVQVFSFAGFPPPYFV